MFSVFKQHCFHILFHQYILKKKIENYCLNIRTKLTLIGLKTIFLGKKRKKEEEEARMGDKTPFILISIF